MIKFDLRSLVVCAAVALIPTFASALTLTVDDLSTLGVDSTTVGSTVVSTFGTVGGFDVAIASGSISTNAMRDTHTLNSTSIQIGGVGTLQVSTEQTGLTGFAFPFLYLTGSGLVTDHGTTVTVEHMIDLGGGYQTIGNVLAFVGGSPGGVNLSSLTTETVAGTPTFDLKSVLTITTASNDQTANVNATLVAAANAPSTVPLPAGGLLLLSGLGGVAALKRRKKHAA